MCSSSIVGRRVWKILRLALIWARKGGLFKHRLALSINVLVKVIKNKLLHSNYEPRGALLYGDREFSFDDTPTVRLRMHRGGLLKMPHIPCIKPHVDFDYDFDLHDDDAVLYGDDEVCYGGDDHMMQQGISSTAGNYLKDVELEVEEEIDVKAEEFIAKFYEEIKMQRQVSYLEYYNEKMK